ncbi:unnamed protein product [Callosobruchus maculatus]|uniref:Major facilitator superfamily (MFS) profile domain-containing protein n=1 Tax=Callosobruchus maculatus TaxID=64391 RepID=A0A653CRE3_CALMS|nr:unnamed protein product [Callosobruchus maculatus]
MTVVEPVRCSRIMNTNVPGIFFQLLAALLVNIIAITDGITLGWTAPLIPYFISEESHIKMTIHEAEMMESWLLYGAITGLPVTMFLVDRIGRKKSVLVSCCVLSICWILVAVATTVHIIYGARFVMGIGLNMAYVAMPMYVGEIAHKNIRGLLSSFTFIFMLLGVLIIYCVGTYTPYYVPPTISVALLVIQFVGFIFMPESAYYLLSKGKEEEARASLIKFRNGIGVEDEFKEMKEAYENSKTEKGRIQDIFLVRSYRKAILTMIFLNLAQLLSSYEIFLMNLHIILEEAGSTYISPGIVGIVFSAVTLTAAAAAATVVDKFGRKILMIISSFLTAICLLCIAIYFHLKVLEYDLTVVNWLPTVAVMAYALSFKFGLGIVPIVLTSEIFAPKMKAIGMTLADGMYVVSSIGALQLYFFLRDTYGMHVPFYLFALFTFFAGPYVWLFVPETKGKTLDEIQDILKEKRIFMIKNTPKNTQT